MKVTKSELETIENILTAYCQQNGNMFGDSIATNYSSGCNGTCALTCFMMCISRCGGGCSGRCTTYAR